MHAESTVSRDTPVGAPSRRCRVLLVEDSARLAASIRDYLERHAFEVFIEGDGLAVAERFERLKPDLVILDLMLPGKDGLTICRELRRFDRIPILILTAKGENIDQVLGLEMGADDYVVKPVEPRVLLARVEALLRRVRSVPAETREARLTAGRLSIDCARRSATIDSHPVDLTTGDFDILWLLASRQGSVVTATRSCAWCAASTTTASTARSTRASAGCAQAPGRGRRGIDDQDRSASRYLFAGES
jgi:two-component system response regulator RstA